MKFILIVLFFIIADMANAQQTINKVKINDLNLPQESASSALTIDAAKKVKASSTVSDTELGYLDGVTSSIQTQLGTKAADSAVVKLTGDQSISGTKTLTGKMVASSTTNGFTPCPSMSQAQRDLTTPSAGDCVYNSTSNKWNIYNGTAWKEAGGGAGGTRLQLMADPSFEEGVTEGTCTTCTASSESSVVLLTPTNEKSGEAAFTASTGNYAVTKNTSAQFAGAQGYVRCQIKTDQAGVKFRAYVDGTNNDSDMDTVSVLPDNIWRPYEIAIVHGSTSAGWAIDATSSITGSVFFDECGVVVGEVGLEVAQAQLAGESYIAGTSSCLPVRTSTTLGALSDTDCPGPTVVTANLGTWATTDNNTIRQDITNLPPGVYKATWQILPASSLSNSASYAITDGTTTCQETGVSGQTAGDAQTITCFFTYATAGTRNFEIYGRSSSGNVIVANDTGAGYSRNSRFTLEYYPPASKVYSAQSNTYDAASFTPTTTWVSNVTQTGRITREGRNARISYQVLATGTPTAANLTLTIPNSLLIDTAALPATPAGATTLNVATKCYILDSGTTSFPCVATYTSTSTVSIRAMNAVTTYVEGAAVSNTIPMTWTTNDALNVEILVPIVGWSQSMITGTFANVVTAPGISKPKECLLQVTGASDNTACTSSPCTERYDSCETTNACTRSGAGLYSCTHADGTWAASSPVMCFCRAVSAPRVEAGDGSVRLSTASGGFTWETKYEDFSSSAADAQFNCLCKGQAP